MEKEKIKYYTIEDDEELLRQVSSEVDIDADGDLPCDIDVLSRFCRAEEVLAMASIQLGIPKRLIYLKNTSLDMVKKYHYEAIDDEYWAHDEAKILINPVVIAREGLTEYWEACKSCLNNCGRVLRPYKIVVEFYDIDGLKHVEEFTGFGATVLSHELDHLDGILHIDIALEVLQMDVEERKVFRRTHEYKIYSETGDYEELKNAKRM